MNSFNTFILVCMMVIAVSIAFIFHDVSKVVTTVHPYSAENIERVVRGEPKVKPVPRSVENVVRVVRAVPKVKPVPHTSTILTEELNCLQANIYFEARNQDELSRIAVGWVTLNRVMSKRYPHTICDVVWDRKQFSWTHDGKSDSPNLKNKLESVAWYESGDIAERLITHCVMQLTILCPSDPTHGAQYYFNPRLANPKWKEEKVKTTSVGDHDFYSSPQYALSD